MLKTRSPTFISPLHRPPTETKMAAAIFCFPAEMTPVRSGPLSFLKATMLCCKLRFFVARIITSTRNNYSCCKKQKRLNMNSQLRTEVVIRANQEPIATYNVKLLRDKFKKMLSVLLGLFGKHS